MRQQARKGDRALVLRVVSGKSSFGNLSIPPGTIVQVLSNPEFDSSVYAIEYYGAATFVSHVYADGYGERWGRTSNLLPLPPDSESRTLFAAEPADGAVRA